MIVLFEKSETYDNLVEFIKALAESVKSLPIKTNEFQKTNGFMPKFDVLFQSIESILNEVEPLEGNMRFGNIAFRTFVERLNQSMPEILLLFLQPRRVCGVTCETQQTTCRQTIHRLEPFPYSDADRPQIAQELSDYLCSSFGDKTRIDYGSGHELNFICFLYCLVRLECFASTDYSNLVNVVFAKYLACVRRVQTRYSLEPAGSRGSWGIDDYHFLPFLFGASQLCDQESITPHQINDPQIVHLYASQYFYMDSVKWILQTKVGALFGECAPLLYDISGISSWFKIYTGLIKMYKAEVLGKLPVIQHFLFGNILPAPATL
ncbi:probable serine/threonine-protein phosphatase 2A activator 2 isoform X2 [Hylaeus volcanicus]|uniref:probable serine/threonine-protein phosphatase 2A activator 2 isoform X2 n=1 Tax=Hylaeus volcanicus TaxID=313075 RepID=UPI0023B7BBE9|nr:probable serine/threonine-protein phosphatase 2A activator 2 isoform X2 [Hylaeus volcanicus]